MADEYPRAQHPPCLACRSLQTISTCDANDRYAFQCPDCGHSWDQPVKSSSPIEHRGSIPAPLRRVS